jgi:large subunit ribosomal protein L32e
MKKLLEIKKSIARKRPKFVRDESYKRKEVGPSWRRPRGQCSKVRRCKAGHMSMVKNGYRGPKAVRFALLSGLVPVRVSTLSDLESLDKTLHTVIIASQVGIRKKMILLDACAKKGLSCNNIKNPQQFIDDIKKAKADKKANATKKKEAEAKEKPKKKKTVDKEVAPEETEEGEKKKLDKLLSKRE